MLVACTSPNPALYTLSPVPGTPQPGSPHVIVLRDVGLTRYLERPQIVRSSEDYRLDVLANDWWGEPLGAMLTRVLLENLAQRLPDASVFRESGAVSVTPDAIVEIEIQRLDEDHGGTLILIAQIGVVFTKPKRPHNTRTVRFMVQPKVPGTSGQVAAASVALGQLADAAAAMLRG
jgi:uncharacterized lipoprotein YmbA